MSEAPNPTILIVDDEEDIRLVVQARLETAGFRVLVAGDGMKALEVIRRDPPDLILLDVMLPGMDGFAVCAMVKRDQRFSRIPVIMLTARCQPQDRHTGIKLGADAYLTKPFRSDELLESIRGLLREHAGPPALPSQLVDAHLKETDERVPVTEAAS
jgi:DNA-binding response OmpR family regulator